MANTQIDNIFDLKSMSLFERIYAFFLYMGYVLIKLVNRNICYLFWILLKELMKRLCDETATSSV